MSRLVSTIALALALTAQVSTLVHMGAVRHETCAEHGELVEVEGAVADDHGARSDGSSAGDDADEHDHCLLATTPALHSIAPSLAHVVHVAAVDDNVSVPAPRVVATTLLRSAPKTSPPLA